MTSDPWKRYEELEEALKKATLVCYGLPDIYQHHQNNLSKAIAKFLLQPYWDMKMEKEKDET